MAQAPHGDGDACCSLVEDGGHGHGALEVILDLHVDGDLVAPHYCGGVLLDGSVSVTKMYQCFLMIHHGTLSHESLKSLSACWRGSRCLLEALLSMLDYGSRGRCRVGGVRRRCR